MDRFVSYALEIVADAALLVLQGMGFGSACFLFLLLIGLDGKAHGWNHSFLFFSLCIVCIAVIRRRSITQEVFHRKFIRLRSYQEKYNFEPYIYTEVSRQLLQAYIQLNTGPATSHRPREGSTAYPSGAAQGSVITIYMMDGLGAGFFSYLIIFLCLAIFKTGPDDFPVSKELLVFCLCTIWVALFSFSGLSSKSQDRKMKFIEKLYRDKYISVIEYRDAMQLVMGWYSNSRIALRPDEPQPPDDRLPQPCPQS
jgi:hypothetical protein